MDPSGPNTKFHGILFGSMGPAKIPTDWSLLEQSWTVLMKEDCLKNKTFKRRRIDMTLRPAPKELDPAATAPKNDVTQKKHQKLCTKKYPNYLLNSVFSFK